MTANLEKLSAELEALGGGGAQVARHRSIVYVGPAGDAGSIVRHTKEEVCVRDPRAPSEAQASADRKFKLPTCIFADQDLHGDRFNAELCQMAMEDISRGFNHTIMCMGQTGAGKTTRLFGRFAWAASAQAGPCCLLTAILRLVLDISDARLGAIQLGLSFWEVVGDEVIDLLAAEAPRGGGPAPTSPGHVHVRQAPGLVLEHTTVRIDSLADADAVAAYARSRSVNWGDCAPPLGGLLAALPNRGHAFVRLLVHNRERGWMSLLHLVDLAGSQPLQGDHRAAALFRPRPEARAYEERVRRRVAQDLLALSRMLTQLASGPPDGSGPQGRDSKLTAALHPLVAGNSRVTLVAAVAPAAGAYLDTCNTLRLAARSQAIAARMLRNPSTGPLLDIPLVWDALPPEALEMAQRAQHAHQGVTHDVVSFAGAVAAQHTADVKASAPTQHAQHAQQRAPPVQDDDAPGADHVQSRPTALPEQQRGGGAGLRRGESKHGCSGDDAAAAAERVDLCDAGSELSLAHQHGSVVEQSTRHAARERSRGRRGNDWAAPDSTAADVVSAGVHGSAACGTGNGAVSGATTDDLALVGRGQHTEGARSTPQHAEHGWSEMATLSPEQRSWHAWAPGSEGVRGDVPTCRSPEPEAPVPSTGENVGTGATASDRAPRAADTAGGCQAAAGGWEETDGNGHGADDVPAAQAAPPRSAAEEEEYRRLMASIVAPLKFATLTGSCGGKGSGETLGDGHSMGPGVDRAAGERGVGAQGAGTAGYAALYLQHRKVPDGPGGSVGAVVRPSTAEGAATDGYRGATSRHLQVSPPRLGPQEPHSSRAVEGPGGVRTNGPANGRWPTGGSSAAGTRGRDAGLEEHRAAQQEANAWRSPALSLSPSAARRRGVGLSFDSAGASPEGDAGSCVPPAVAAAACSYALSNACGLRQSIPPAAACMRPEPRQARPQSAGPCAYGARAYSGCPPGALRPAAPPAAGVAELMEQREVLLETLERERLQLAAARQRAREVEADLQECSMTYEVQLDSERLRRIELERQLAALQAGSSMAEVFAQYERDLEAAAREARELKAANAALLRAQHRDEYAAALAATAPGGAGVAAGGEPCTGDAAGKPAVCPEMGLPKDQRVAMLRRQLRRALLERDAALEEISSFRKKERLHVLKQKQAALAIARVTELERVAARKEREAAARTREAALFCDEASDSRRRATALEEEVAALQARCRAAEAASKHAQAELQQLRSARGAAAVVAALPPLPGGGGAPAGVLSPKQAKAAPSAIDGVVALVRKLRQAPLPAAAQKLADKLEASTQAVAEEAAARKARERILLEYVQGTPPHGRPAPT